MNWRYGYEGISNPVDTRRKVPHQHTDPPIYFGQYWMDYNGTKRRILNWIWNYIKVSLMPNWLWLSVTKCIAAKGNKAHKQEKGNGIITTRVKYQFSTETLNLKHNWNIYVSELCICSKVWTFTEVPGNHVSNILLHDILVSVGFERHQRWIKDIFEF